MQEIISAVQSVGFPIVASGAVAWYAYTMQNKANATIDALRDTLERNTIVLTRVCERLGGVSDED